MELARCHVTRQHCSAAPAPKLYGTEKLLLCHRLRVEEIFLPRLAKSWQADVFRWPIIIVMMIIIITFVVCPDAQVTNVIPLVCKYCQQAFTTQDESLTAVSRHFGALCQGLAGCATCLAKYCTARLLRFPV